LPAQKLKRAIGEIGSRMHPRSIEGSARASIYLCYEVNACRECARASEQMQALP
jgi:hypothetical protein